jgi:hypothetical protein
MVETCNVFVSVFLQYILLYFGICLLLFDLAIILDRISGILETGIRKEQAGFRPNRSCIDQINTLRIIIKQSLEFQSPLYLLFVDYQKEDGFGKLWRREVSLISLLN